MDGMMHRIARRIVTAKDGWTMCPAFGERTRRVLRRLEADEINGGQAYEIEISDTYYLKDIGQYADFKVWLRVEMDGGDDVEMKVADWNNGSWTEYDRNDLGIDDESFRPVDDAGLAARVESFVKYARTALHGLCLEIQRRHGA